VEGAALSDYRHIPGAFASRQQAFWRIVTLRRGLHFLKYTVILIKSFNCGPAGSLALWA
jgi:hypothetical protein